LKTSCPALSMSSTCAQSTLMVISVTFIPRHFLTHPLGDTGSTVRYADIPPNMTDAAKSARRALVESVGEVDEEMVRTPFVTTSFCLIVSTG
jgi:hypothetical protein